MSNKRVIRITENLIILQIKGLAISHSFIFSIAIIKKELKILVRV
jgi:hypothetical protein